MIPTTRHKKEWQTRYGKDGKVLYSLPLQERTGEVEYNPWTQAWSALIVREGEILLLPSYTTCAAAKEAVEYWSQQHQGEPNT